MLIELLVVPDCPHQVAAERLLRSAMASCGLAEELRIIIVDNDQDAHARNFCGSPSFYVDGIDMLPSPGAQAGVTCRMYAGDDHPSGLPSMESLVAALMHASSGHLGG